MKPITLKLLNPETGAVTRTITKPFVPWRTLKSALKVQKMLSTSNEGEMSEEDIDSITGLIASFFGIEESRINDECSAGAVNAAFREIMSRAVSAQDDGIIEAGDEGNAKRPRKTKTAA